MLDQEPRHEAGVDMTPANKCSIAYLTSTYPMLSMTFVLREVLQLRQMGFRIDVASINPPDRAIEDLTKEEAAEALLTYHLKSSGLTGPLTAHLRALAENFSGYWHGLKFAISLGGLDLTRLALNYVYFTEALMVGMWMKRKKQQHLHVHLGQQAATVGMFVQRVFGFGFSITLHGPDEFYNARGQYLEQKVAAADFICCISFYARSQLMKFSPYTHWHKIVVLRLGVDPAVFLPRLSRPASNIFEILCVGRLTPAKGQHILIDAVEQLAQQGRRVRLRLVGAGPDGVSLCKRAALMGNPDLVVFEGAVNQDNIRTLYGVADLFCIPSFAEGIPVVLMEAMAMEIPCVTTRITGIPELIRDGIDGLLVTPSDLEGLTEALARLMDDSVLREQIGKAARRRILADYDLQRNVEGLATTFIARRKVLSESAPAGSQSRSPRERAFQAD